MRKRATMSSSNQSPSTIGMTLSASGSERRARHLGEVVLQRRALVGEDQPRLVEAVATEHAADGVGDEVCTRSAAKRGSSLWLGPALYRNAGLRSGLRGLGTSGINLSVKTVEPRNLRIDSTLKLAARSASRRPD